MLTFTPDQTSIAAESLDCVVGTALAIGLAVSAGATAASSIYSAHKQSEASKQAAKIQTDAADKSQGVLDNLYSPYLNTGRTAASTLGRLTTPGPGARYAAPDPTQAPPPGNTAVPRFGAMAQGAAGMAAQLNGGSMRKPMTLGGMMPQQQGSGGGAPQAPPGMVLIEAPNGGGTRPVPAEQADRYIAMGGRRVS